MPCFTGNLDEADAAIAPLRALGEVLVDQVGAMPYPAIYNLTAAAEQPHFASVRMMFSDDLSDGAIQGIIDSVAVAPSPMAMVQLRALGGAFAEVGPTETAFAHRERRLMVSVLGLWLDPTDDPDQHTAWTEAAWKRLRQEGDGCYSNFLGDEGEARIRDAYPPFTYNRLAALKRQYDPGNFFQLNQNIRPR
jgi:hypothetical protein